MSPKTVILHFLFVLWCLVGFANSIIDYYWRPNLGLLPKDAYSAGKNANGDYVFIGQVAIEKHPGVYPAPIYMGRRIVASKDGPQQAWNFVQILCTPYPEKFVWLPRTQANVHMLPDNVYPVIGGIEDGKYLYIGKIHYQGQTVIGKILSGHIGKALMYYAHNNEEMAVDTYQLLTYTEDYDKYGNSINDIGASVV
ncbi:uncharacterized protein LOC115889384 [Sitophilus oryzae]|uniref:Uncharacterized protein LOC115889384 n=1 Tax=Sitophilus oryzae TaxID=7048 RepID=A0A6J2YPM5_SITOR|nr:uncharacterized protein LOC115889384 [Sitophilus oryzae]